MDAAAEVAVALASVATTRRAILLRLREKRRCPIRNPKQGRLGVVLGENLERLPRCERLPLLVMATRRLRKRKRTDQQREPEVAVPRAMRFRPRNALGPWMMPRPSPKTARMLMMATVRMVPMLRRPNECGAVLATTWVPRNAGRPGKPPITRTIKTR